MKIAELKSVLEEIEAIYLAGGAKKAAEDFGDISRLFDDTELSDVDDFIAELKQLYVAPAKPKLRLVETVDELLVERYLKKLNSLDQSGDGDQALLEELASDSAVNKAEVNLIQYRFLQGRERWPSKKAALQAISKRLAHRRREAEQLKRIDDMTPW